MMQNAKRGGGGGGGRRINRYTCDKELIVSVILFYFFFLFIVFLGIDIIRMRLASQTSFSYGGKGGSEIAGYATPPSLVSAAFIIVI